MARSLAATARAVPWSGASCAEPGPLHGESGSAHVGARSAHVGATGPGPGQHMVWLSQWERLSPEEKEEKSRKVVNRKAILVDSDILDTCAHPSPPRIKCDVKLEEGIGSLTIKYMLKF